MKLFEFILLLISASCFLIYENIPLNTYATKVKKELKQIGALHALEETIFPKYEIYTTDDIYYSLSSLRTKAVFLNVEMLSPSVNNFESSVALSLSWEARNGDTNYLSPYHSIFRAFLAKNEYELGSTAYEIEFEVEASKFKFSKTWEYYFEDEFYIPKGSIDNTYTSFKVKCVDDCPFDNDILFEIVNAFLSAKKDELNDIFTNKGIEPFYKSLPFEELVQKIYTETSTSISNENNIDLSLELMPEYNTNSGFIFKRKGKLNDLNITDSATTDENSSQRFNINIKLIQHLIAENLFNIIYEQTNNPSTAYELTVAYLKQIMDVSSYADSTELKVSAEMIDVNFYDENAISGYVTLDVNVIAKSDLENLLNFSLKIEFKLTPTLLQNGLNFVLLEKNIKILEIKPSQTVRDEDLLRSWVQNTYIVSLGNNEYNLFSLDFDLSFYFSTNKLSYEFTNGYLNIKKE